MNTAELKEILENIQDPRALDSHPWVSLKFVQTSPPAYSPGEKLVRAIFAIFRKSMPGMPPRRGIRLDTHWAEFGLLAAQYFAPAEFGAITPRSLRDAWSKIDASILLYVFGRIDGLTQDDVEAYTLVGHEKEIAPDSTLSDWHRKGIARLAQTIQTRENYLSNHDDEQVKQQETSFQLPARKPRKLIFLGALIVFLGVMIWGGVKVRRVYNMATIVLDDVQQLRGFADAPNMDNFESVGTLLSKTHQDVSELKDEVKPYLWATPLLKWVPTYGGDIASSSMLLEIADSMLTSADMAYQAGASLLDDVTDSSGDMHISPPQLIGSLSDIRPQMMDASEHLQIALDAREQLDVDALSPRVHDLVIHRVDPLLGLMQDGLVLAVELPRLAGASADGPKTYLVLVQNEDEIRPTGGFITAAGSFVARDGVLSELKFDDSGKMDEWDQPYPSAPWQLSEYMNNPVMVFRDSNWFVDFPRSALYAEYLYVYAKGHSVDGVIAIDQQMLAQLLRVTGPINVEGTDELVSADNVISFMRESKIWTSEAAALQPTGWNNKIFLDRISASLLKKIFSGDVPTDKLIEFIFRVLNERHLLVQFDDEAISDLLSRRNWDGTVHVDRGDFLMVVDSNIGFNKTNAVVDEKINYSIDLTNPAVPVGELSVEHTNHSAKESSCSLRERITIKDQGNYPIDRCYWNYLRVYTVNGTRLLQSNPQAIPAEWMLRGKAISAHVDTLNEDLDGIITYGLLKVVQGEQTVTTKLKYVLPVDVLSIVPGTRQVVYHLNVKKQPGTIAIPITIQVTLPEDVVLISSPGGSQVTGSVIVFEGNLRTDLELDVIFEVP